MFCLKCPQTPALREPWSDAPLPENSLTVPEDAFCRGCGYSFGKDHKSKSMWRCTKCNDYFVCTNCKLCKNNHHLIKRYNLKNHGSAGSYKENAYSCDFCSNYVTLKPATKLENPTEAQKFDAFLAEHNGKTGNSFVWHCLGCKYDICPKHFTNSKLGVYKAPDPTVAAVEKAPNPSEPKVLKTGLFSSSFTVAKKQLVVPPQTLSAPPLFGAGGAFPYPYLPPVGTGAVGENGSLKFKTPPAGPMISLDNYMSALHQYQSGLFSSSLPKPSSQELGMEAPWPTPKSQLFAQSPVEMQKMYEKFKQFQPPTLSAGLFPPKVVGRFHRNSSRPNGGFCGA